MDKDTLLKELKNISRFVTEDEFLDALKKSLSSLEKREKEISGKFNILNRKIDKRLAEIKDGKDGINGRDGIDGRDGLDADEERIIESVFVNLKENIKIPTIDDFLNNLKEYNHKIRDALELLEGDDRLEISAIKGLEERLEKMVKGSGTLGGGMSANALELRFVDDEVPTGTINGTNKIFTTDLAPNPVSSLKVYVNGQRMKINEDYTLSSNTITFVTAPPTGSIVLCDYRT